MSGPPQTRRSPGRAPRATSANDLQADEASLTVAKQIRLRRDAALRCAPFDDAGHRDPIDILADEVRDIVPWERFGLPEEVRRRHGNELVTHWHWSVEEVVQVLGIYPQQAA